METKKTRINKHLADIGMATRKEADKLVEKGVIFINGKVAKLGDKVGKNDEVTMNGHVPKTYAYYAYYKRKGVETLASKGETGIKETIHFPVKVFPIGRLDKDSEGLIIMTNDGRITERLLSPKQEHEKEYLVVVNKPLTDIFMRRIRDGVLIGRGEKTKKAKARRIDNETFEIAITEGKNRQVRRMCLAFGYGVKKLTRFRIMNIELGKLKPGTYRNIEKEELQEFLKSLGL